MISRRIFRPCAEAEAEAEEDEAEAEEVEAVEVGVEDLTGDGAYNNERLDVPDELFADGGASDIGTGEDFNPAPPLDDDDDDDVESGAVGEVLCAGFAGDVHSGDVGDVRWITKSLRRGDTSCCSSDMVQWPYRSATASPMRSAWLVLVSLFSRRLTCDYFRELFCLAAVCSASMGSLARHLAITTLTTQRERGHSVLVKTGKA